MDGAHYVEFRSPIISYFSQAQLKLFQKSAKGVPNRTAVVYNNAAGRGLLKFEFGLDSACRHPRKFVNSKSFGIRRLRNFLLQSNTAYNYTVQKL